MHVKRKEFVKALHNDILSVCLSVQCIWNFITSFFTCRYPINARSNSVDAIIQISDSIVCTGGMDGYLRYNSYHIVLFINV